MAEISSYPVITPKAQDVLVGTETYVAGISEVTGNPTRGFTVQSIVDKVPSIQLGYTSLVQLITVTTSNLNPVATEVYNNTGQTYNWTYVAGAGPGVYRINATGAPFTVNKTVVFLNTGSNSSSSIEPLWERISDSIIEVRVESNNSITKGSFEIKIYN